MPDLRAQIVARLDTWAAADDPGDVFDATERMYNALRAVVAVGDGGPSLPEPLMRVIAAELGITEQEETSRA